MEIAFFLARFKTAVLLVGPLFQFSRYSFVLDFGSSIIYNFSTFVRTSIPSLVADGHRRLIDVGLFGKYLNLNKLWLKINGCIWCCKCMCMYTLRNVSKNCIYDKTAILVGMKIFIFYANVPSFRNKLKTRLRAIAKVTESSVRIASATKRGYLLFTRLFLRVSNAFAAFLYTYRIATNTTVLNY